MHNGSTWSGSLCHNLTSRDAALQILVRTKSSTFWKLESNAVATHPRTLETIPASVKSQHETSNSDDVEQIRQPQPTKKYRGAGEVVSVHSRGAGERPGLPSGPELQSPLFCWKCIFRKVGEYALYACESGGRGFDFSATRCTTPTLDRTGQKTRNSLWPSGEVVVAHTLCSKETRLTRTGEAMTLYLPQKLMSNSNPWGYHNRVNRFGVNQSCLNDIQCTCLWSFLKNIGWNASRALTGGV